MSSKTLLSNLTMKKSDVIQMGFPLKLISLLTGVVLMSCSSIKPTTSVNQSFFSNAINEAEIALETHNLQKIDRLLRKELKTNSIIQQVDSLLIASKYQFALGDYLKAKDIAENAHQLMDKQSNSSLLFKILTWKGRMSIEWMDLKNTRALFQEAKTISNQQKLNNTTSFRYLQYYLGLLKIAENDYSAVDSIFQDLLDLPDLKKKSDILFYKATYSLGESKGEQELFDEAKTILNKIDSVIKKEKGDNYLIRILPLNHLGRFYEETKEYKKAAFVYEEAMNIAKENNLSETHPIYGDLLSNYGKLLSTIGEFEKAESTLLIADQILKETFSNSLRYIAVLGLLEDLYSKIGQHDKSIIYALKQKDIFKKSRNYSNYARVLNNLSATYYKQQKIDKAEQLFKEGLSLLKDNNQTHTSLYAGLLMNYSNLKIDSENFEEAQKLLEEAKVIIVRVFGNIHPYYASIIYNLARLNKKKENYQEAKNYYLETGKLDSITLGIRHPYYIGTTYNLAGIHELTEETALAQKYYQSANTGQVNLIYNYYSGFDEAIRLSYLADTEPDFYKFLSFAWRHHQEMPSLTKEAQNLNLAVKNLALDFSAQNQIQVSTIQDSSLLKTHQEWIATKKQLSKSYIQTPEEQTQSGIDITELENKAELLEKELVRNEVLSMEDLADQHRTTSEEIKSNLAANEAAIDFIRFPYYTPERKTDSVYYCALINRNTLEQPTLIYLEEEKELKRLLRANIRLKGSNYIENQKIGDQLYQKIWQPLESHLEGVDQIALSVSGLLHKVSFGAMQSDNQSPLIDQYNFTYYDNLKYITHTTPPSSDATQSITLMGAANFDLDSMQLAELAKQRQTPIFENIIEIPSLEEYAEEEEAVATRSGVIFNYLPATQKEVEDIALQFRTKNWKVNAYTALNAVEEQFKLLEGPQAPSILHIATHGYFFEPLKAGRKVPNNARGRIMAAKNPLLRSGLALSGANYAWKKGKTIANIEDGILTAYEIANQNLSKTKLVVLSACETGLGDVVSGEGVFGLQRAFKMAGVENMLISLWKVPDQQTQELMAAFYKYYLDSEDATTALHQAQLEMSKQYRPFYWGGFIVAR